MTSGRTIFFHLISSVLCLMVADRLTAQPYAQLKANLVALNSGGAALADGNSVVFDSSFSNDVDNYDITKQSNFGENFGILRNGITFAVEARKNVTNTDTVYYRLWNLKQQSYQFQFVPRYITTPGLSARLYDNFLASSFPLSLSDTTTVQFTVSSASGSSAQDRFKVILSISTLPLTFVAAGVGFKDGLPLIRWTIAGSENIRHFEVEQSIDGRHFEPIATVNAISAGATNASYSWMHRGYKGGQVYYRIKAVDVNGRVTYSAIISADKNSRSGFVLVQPNGLSGSAIYFRNQPAGMYLLRLLSTSGQLLSAKVIQHSEGSTFYNIAGDGSVLQAGIVQVITNEQMVFVSRLLP